MLSIVFFCSSDLYLGCPCFMRPKSLLSSYCSFSISSKGISPLCNLLKICIGLSNLIKPTGVIFESLLEDSQILANPSIK